MSDKLDLSDVVNRINRRRYIDLVVSLDNEHSEYNQLMEQVRAEEISQKAFKAGSEYRLLAMITPEQDAEFTRRFGRNYYKDKEFFTKRFPQTLALKSHQL